MMNPIIFGIGNAIPQIAAHAHRSNGVHGASRAAYRYVLFGLGQILVICAAALLMPDLLLRTVYGASSPYLAVAIGLQLLAIAGVLEYIAEMISKTLLGVQAGKLAFLVNVVAAAVALVLALVLVGPMGVFGACVALLMANLVRVIGAVAAIGWLITRERARERVQLASDGNASAAWGCCRASQAMKQSTKPHTMSDTLRYEIPARAFRGRSLSGAACDCCWAMR